MERRTQDWSSTKISSLQFNTSYPPFLLFFLFFIYQQLYLFQIKLDFSKWQQDLLKIKESFPQSCKFKYICFEEAFVKKIRKVKYFFSIFSEVDNWLYSTTPPSKLGSGELVCKVHHVQFQLKYTRVHIRVHLSSQARIGELKHEAVSVKFSPFSGELHL